jgi:hypothetical protein
MRSLLSLAMVAAVAGCVGVQSGAKPTTGTYKFASYSIDVPPGGDWGVSEVDHESERIEFSTASYAFMAGSVTSSTSLGVAKVPVPEDKWSLGEEEAANLFRDLREKSLAKEAASQSYELKNVRKGMADVAGKKLYTMSYEGGMGNWFVGGKGYETYLYLYFPPDYAQRHAFYLFHISTASVKGSIYSQSASLKLLLSFLGGFQLGEIAP